MFKILLAQQQIKKILLEGNQKAFTIEKIKKCKCKIKNFFLIEIYTKNTKNHLNVLLKRKIKNEKENKKEKKIDYFQFNFNEIE